MEIKISQNRLTVKSEYFDIAKILYSGQAFRFKHVGQGEFELSSGGHFAVLAQRGDTLECRCTDADFFYNYFDLQTDYREIFNRLEQFEVLRPALEHCRGLRILRQPPLETIITFIVSANNNIKRIQGIMERICGNLGERSEFGGSSYYKFPSAGVLASAGTQAYRELGAGYRAPYIDFSANVISAGGFDINEPFSLSSAEAEKKLLALKGIGKKVSDCIQLFAYYKQDVFPVDTWIEKVYYSYFSGGEEPLDRKGISRRLTGIFGELSGYAQQLLFYYKREYDKIL